MGIKPAGATSTDLGKVSVAAQGLLAESFPASFVSSQLVPTTQTIFATLLSRALAAGVAVTSVVFDVTTAAAGTTPTNMYVAILDATPATLGNVLAVSADLKANAGWTAAGKQAFPCAYTPSTDIAVMAAILQNGAFGTTPLQLGRLPAMQANANIPLSGKAPASAQSAAGQTSFPSVGSPVTFQAATVQAFWAAAA